MAGTESVGIFPDVCAFGIGGGNLNRLEFFIMQKVLFGTPSDIESWMDLVNQVSWNFPGLETQEKIEEHKETVLRFMGKKQALCMKDKNEIAGVILFSRKHNMICCLAVSPQYRKC